MVRVPPVGAVFLPTVCEPKTPHAPAGLGQRPRHRGEAVIVSDHEPDEQSPHQPQQHGQPGLPPDVDAVRIPMPRPPLDDQPDIPVPPPPAHPPDRWRHHGGVQPENGLVEPEFRYDQTWKRGKRRHYNGFVERVGGPEGERLRQDLTAALRDLLDWAFHDTHDVQDGHRDSGLGDGRDGGGRDGESGMGSGQDGDTR